MRLWVEPVGGEQKSADIERKIVMLIYPYPKVMLVDITGETNSCKHGHTVVNLLSFVS